MFTTDLVFQPKVIEVLSAWDIQYDSVTIVFVAHGYMDYSGEEEAGYSVFLVDNVSASYTSATEPDMLLQPFNIYPNPSAGDIYIEPDPDVSSFEVEVYNSLGKVVHRSNARGSLMISDLPNGYYHVVCMIGGEIYARSFGVIW